MNHGIFPICLLKNLGGNRKNQNPQFAISSAHPVGLDDSTFKTIWTKAKLELKTKETHMKRCSLEVPCRLRLLSISFPQEVPIQSWGSQSFYQHALLNPPFSISHIVRKTKTSGSPFFQDHYFQISLWCLAPMFHYYKFQTYCCTVSRANNLFKRCNLCINSEFSCASI